MTIYISAFSGLPTTTFYIAASALENKTTRRTRTTIDDNSGTEKLGSSEAKMLKNKKMQRTPYNKQQTQSSNRPPLN